MSDRLLPSKLAAAATKMESKLRAVVRNKTVRKMIFESYVETLSF